jgi:hypothetical protein
MENDRIVTARHGSPIHFNDWIARALTHAAAKAGLSQTSHHTRCRSPAIELDANGAVAKSIQDRLRLQHADPAMSRIVYRTGVPELHWRGSSIDFRQGHGEAID